MWRDAELPGLDQAYTRGLEPEPQSSVTEWADAHRWLPSTTAEPGPWRTSRTPYLAGIMDALSTTSPIERVVFQKGAQLGGTEAGLNWLGYVVQRAPGLMLYVMPSLDMVRRTVRTRIDPMLEASPMLRELVASPRSRDTGNSQSLKSFPGGQIAFTGANSAAGLRSTPARYLMLDEVDGFPVDADGEGDPVALAVQRTVTFKGRRKVYEVSTPTLAGISRIEKSYAESDQRRYFVPCPHCGEFQTLEWQRVGWPEGRRDLAHYVCAECGVLIAERDKAGMLALGEWRATAEGDGRTAGFKLSALYSPFTTWGEIAIEHGKVHKDPPRYQTWVNLALGEAFEDRDTAEHSPEALQDRAEHPDVAWSTALPAGVVVLTAGVDVQDDRLEVEIVGWGRGEESWSVAYEIIAGDTSRDEPWIALDRLLARRWAHSRAVVAQPLGAVAIDSGGHRTDRVMRFSAGRLHRRVWAIKGRGGPGVPVWPRLPPKPLPDRVAPLHIVGVDSLKATLMSRLRIEVDPERPDRAPPGYMHLPAERDYAWFAGLLAERAVRRWVRGVPRIEWVPDRSVRNEPLDTRVYATAALHGLYAAGFRLDVAVQQFEAIPLRAGAPASPSSAEGQSTARGARPARKGRRVHVSSYMTE